MTVLADHASPYRAATLPLRAPLVWRPEGRHYLVSDETGLSALQRFAATGPQALTVMLGAAPLGTLGPSLAEMESADHLLALGTEAFLQKINALAWGLRLGPDRLQCQRIGPDARDVLCLNCRAICHAVARRIHRCDCGIDLLVRDHFSARRGLYQGAPLPPDDDLIARLSGQFL